MRPSVGLAAQAVLAQPHVGIKNLFVFGDSYTSTGFNTSGPQPSLSDPLGNPVLGQGTSTNGNNWVGYTAAVYNTSLLLAYDLAVYGATIDNNIVSAVPHDLVYQVETDFRERYCKDDENPQEWNSEDTLFAIWIGINDIHFSYERDDTDEVLTYLFQRHLQLAETMYNCGARRFLLINVPPLSRTPTYLKKDEWHRNAHQVMVEKFNNRLALEKRKFEKRFPDSSTSLYDSWSFFTEILNHPTGYGFDADTSCIGNGCLWWDSYHPTSAVHSLLAQDLQQVIPS
ncbi:uncharacterized protein N7446_000608 [Penicillium canescens]|uniref:uncharacterized protein n=1 Tax=Penicillium canescens TaxID=5083 RepID=UPI0026DF3BC6|nr:uncharacterized protein N7446_000608 [Penicillium canescens]KAJ6077672.1 hypothetical protein N7446_000608 [Penicillium canescens]KAJ6154438.1 hypothetical protein N7485_012807 [Penicillium canescens]